MHIYIDIYIYDFMQLIFKSINRRKKIYAIILSFIIAYMVILTGT